MVPADQIAVIVGIGEAVDRSREPERTAEPTALISEALRKAADDAGEGWLDRIDAVDLVALVSWRYKNPVGDICARLGISPPHQANTRSGGETPVRLLHEAALKVTSGRQKICAVIGGESAAARARARRTGATLPWTSLPSPEESARFAGYSTVRSSLAERYDMLEPARIYPLYETAAQKAWGQSPADANDEFARLWARYAEVASDNPSAWVRTAPDPATIGTVGPDNRLINWPYPKLMVANPFVNQAAAFIVTSLAEARAAGVPEDRLVYVWGGAAANEPADFLERGAYDRSSAQEVVLERASDIAGGVDALSFAELYSCFPVIPKMALRTLGIDPDRVAPTVTGGLTFFGGPLHNYMGHAVCAMVRRLREQPSASGLLYGQGGYVTKHHALILAARAPGAPLEPFYSMQAEAERRRAPSPVIREDYEGPAAIEAYTVQYARDGKPIQGIVVLRTPRGERTMASVAPDQARSIDLLQSSSGNAVGITGEVRLNADGRATWTAALGATAATLAGVKA